MTTTSFKLDDDIEGKLSIIAKNLRRSKSWIINDALRSYIAREETMQQMLSETEETLAELETGLVVSCEDMMQWLETWGKDD
ncbi:MAG: ribbon-helix-helix protein, CopG family [Xenococcus sp. MO_188.B8]|nr:ribbon-helix-helix protein, CopG family [Xenococcus sp. MO_188.B8]